MITIHNLRETLEPVSDQMPRTIYDAYAGLFEMGSSPELPEYQQTIDLLNEWYDLVKPVPKKTEVEAGKEIDYIEYYNLTGFNLESKVEMIKQWHESMGFPLIEKNMQITKRKLIYSSAEIFDFSPSTVRAILNNVLLTDSKITENE
jgi:hypothetical protein